MLRISGGRTMTSFLTADVALYTFNELIVQYAPAKARGLFCTKSWQELAWEEHWGVWLQTPPAQSPVLSPPTSALEPASMVR